MNATAQFQDRLNQVAKDTEALLDRLLGAALLGEEIGRPARLLDSMRYASLGAGKRFRPFLVVEMRVAVRRRSEACADGRRRARMRALLFAGA